MIGISWFRRFLSPSVGGRSHHGPDFFVLPICFSTAAGVVRLSPFVPTIEFPASIVVNTLDADSPEDTVHLSTLDDFSSDESNPLTARIVTSPVLLSMTASPRLPALLLTRVPFFFNVGMSSASSTSMTVAVPLITGGGVALTSVETSVVSTGRTMSETGTPCLSARV